MARPRANRGYGNPLVQPAGLPAVMLGVDDEGHLVWSPALPPPGVTNVLIQSADTVDGPWVDFENIGWDEQPWTVAESHQAWRIIGVDEDAVSRTNPSNVVDLL